MKDCPLSDINLSFNCNLTGISLRRLLECRSIQNINLVGCDKILQYFGDCGENDYLFQDHDPRQRRCLRISGKLGENENQVHMLLTLFKSKYEQCYIDRQDCVGVSVLKICTKPLDRKINL